MSFWQVLPIIVLLISPFVGAHVATNLGYGLLGNIVGGVVAFTGTFVIIALLHGLLMLVARREIEKMHIEGQEASQFGRDEPD